MGGWFTNALADAATNIWVVTIAIAVVVILVTRGSLASLAKVRLRSVWLLGIALVLQVATSVIPFPDSMLDTVGFGLLMASYVALLAFCFVNVGLRGMGVVTVGVLMNTVVIGLNQGMPVIDEVWRDGAVVEEPVERTVKHRPASDSDMVPFLGDIILLPETFNQVLSFGDIVLALGLIDVAFWGSRRRNRAGELIVASSRADRRARARRERRRERLGLQSPEPIFIDLTEPEPLDAEIVEAEPVEYEPAEVGLREPISVDLVAEEAQVRERVASHAGGAPSQMKDSPYDALAPDVLEREWDQVVSTGELPIVPGAPGNGNGNGNGAHHADESATNEPIEWKAPMATIDLSAYENIKPRPRTKLMHLPPNDRSRGGPRPSDVGDSDSAAL